MITQWILSILTLMIGYYLGSKRDIGQDYATWKKELIKKFDSSPVGPVKRPSAQSVYERNHPEIAQEKEAMKATLDAIIPKG